MLVVYSNCSNDWVNLDLEIYTKMSILSKQILKCSKIFSFRKVQDLQIFLNRRLDSSILFLKVKYKFTTK